MPVCVGLGLMKISTVSSLVGRVVALGELRHDVGVGALVSDVQKVVVPQQARGGLLLGAGLRLPRKNQLHRVRLGPGFFVRLAIDLTGVAARWTS